jgi:hypothetical protein
MRYLSSLLAASMFASACGGGTEPRDDGSYSGTVTGVVTTSFEGGSATFVEEDASESTISLIPGRPDGWLFFIYINPGTRPTVGTTFPIVSDDFPRPTTTHAIVAVTDFAGTTTRNWMSQSGELRINVSTPTRLAGTFQFTARGAGAFPVAGEITIDGMFDAVCGPPVGC